MPKPPPGSVRYKTVVGGEKEYQVYKDGKWKKLKGDEPIREALLAAPVLMPWSGDKQRPGEMIEQEKK